MIKLLLVDDDESNRLTMAALLEDEGYDVVVAASFADAEAILTDNKNFFELVLLDHSLGDGFGSELVPIVRERLPNAKVVAMSGSSGADIAMMRADLALTKGLHFPEFVRQLRRLSAAAVRTA